MATPTVLSVMTEERMVHPFFARTPIHRDGHEASSTDGADTTDAGEGDDVNREMGKVKSSNQPYTSSTTRSAKVQKTLQELMKPITSVVPSGAVHTEEPSNPASHEPDFEPSPRRKRRRTSLEENGEPAADGKPVENGAGSDGKETSTRAESPQVIILASSPLPATEIGQDTEAQKTPPPKKMLRLNASGKFSSPISKKPNDEEPPPHTPKRRGRPRKSKEKEEAKQLMVVMKYEGMIGNKIDRMLSGEERHTQEPKSSTMKKQRTRRKQQPPKSTHPFFLGKPKQPEPKQPSPRKASAVTPGKLRRQTMEARSPTLPTARQAQDYVVGSGLLKDRLMFRHPGAKEPAWPNREQRHVRGLNQPNVYPLPNSSAMSGERKRKAPRLPFPIGQSILHRFSASLEPEQNGHLRADGFRDPHPSLTLPTKLLIPGQDIARRIRPELSTYTTNGIQDELAPSVLHPVSQKLYNMLDSTFSAFDMGHGESSVWTQKYEPSCTADVLQPSREMNVLRDWLTSLTVNAVIGITNIETKLAAKAEVKAKKKRRRKADDMDDFLVSDDEEIHDMDELMDPDDKPPSSATNAKTTKSVVQVATHGVRLSNAVLLSGPHGCGKTASAYAVAKELGFKVFEISSGERRSGKDILDKVGNMTENHLVKHHGIDTAENSAAEEPPQIDEALQRDLASGRQGTMNSFFKPKAPKAMPATTGASSKAVVPQKKPMLEAVQKAVKKPSKDQQQSLILLEEVDILFKDDKEFWNMIFKLIQSSKRPFIMTCNDEDLVPLQAMSLHAILRFSPPPVDLVADYLLLMAANQGHLLKREAVTSLYQSKCHDLRASIAELNFWCQMGVGDPRVGLSWIYQRYPPGSDVDAEGRKLRVVSEGTFEPAMSLSVDRIFDDEIQLLWMHQQNGSELTEILGWELDRNQQLSLAEFCSASDALSEADICSGRFCPHVLDTTQPEMSGKMRSHYIEGMQLLQTDEAPAYSNLTTQLYISSTLLALRSTNAISPSEIRSQSHTTTLAPTNDPTLTRHDFTCFDPLSIPSESTLSTAPGLTQSAFDGPLKTIATDLAPYVRSIARHEIALIEQQDRLAGILSDGRQSKRARTTRAARSALEGGQRASTRREKWFPKTLDLEAVLATAGRGWPDGVACAAVTDVGTETEGIETPASSPEVKGEV